MSPVHWTIQRALRIWIFIHLLLHPALLPTTGAETPYERQEIIRLNPTQFPTLPAGIRKELEHRDCTIPQPYNRPSASPVNVVQAEFAAKGQRDWAVLCSHNDISTILLFWGGPIQCAAQLHSRSDAGYIQGIGGGQKVFSREISAITPAEITALAENFGEGGYPKTEGQHQGLSDAFSGKASEVLYCVKGTWMAVAGAD